MSRSRPQLRAQLPLTASEAELIAAVSGIGIGAIGATWLICRATGMDPRNVRRLCHWEILDLCKIDPDDREVLLE